MFEVPYASDSDAAGPWWRYLRTEDGLSAWMKCPNGHLATLTDHQIDANGTVAPSVVCPEDCSFHEFVRLVGWDPTK